jgi:hypothetical protein
MVWDDRAITHLQQNDHAYDVMITVGLFTNNLVGWLRNQGDLRLFDLDYTGNWDEREVNEVYGHIALARRVDGRIMKQETWDMFKAIDQELDRGLVAKLQLGRSRGSVTILIVGGIEAYGTEEICKFVQTDWRALMDWRDEDSGQRVGDREFALVTDVAYGKTKDTTTVKRVCVECQIPC